MSIRAVKGWKEIGRDEDCKTHLRDGLTCRTETRYVVPNLPARKVWSSMTNFPGDALTKLMRRGCSPLFGNYMSIRITVRQF